MPKNLTPEKKAQLKKSVLDSIDEANIAPKLKSKPVDMVKKIAENQPKKKIEKKLVASPVKIVAKPIKLISPVKKESAKKLVKENVLNTFDDIKAEPKKADDWDNKFFDYKPEKIREKKVRKLNKIIITIIGIVVVLVLLFGLDIYGLYKLDWQDGFTKKVASIFNLPVATVNGKSILFANYLNDLKILDYALNNEREGLDSNTSSTATTLNNKRTILDRLIYVEVAKSELEKYGKSISEDDLNNSLNELITQFGNKEEAEKSVQKLYGINLDQFKTKVLRPLLERDLLQKLISADLSLEINKEAQSKAESILKLAMTQGTNFSELAKQYTDDEAGINTGGDLGFINKGELPADIEKDLFVLPNNSVFKKVVKSELGYHIFYVENKLTDEKTKKEVIKLKQILIKVDVNAYMQKLIESSKVKKFVKVD